MRHVGRGAAAEVAIGELWNLGEERDPHASLETAPHAQQRAGRGHLQCQDRQEQREEKDHATHALLCGTELAPDIQQAAKQERFDGSGEGRRQKREDDRERSEHAVLAEHVDDLAHGPGRRFTKRGRELGRQGWIVSHRVARAHTVDPHQHASAKADPRRTLFVG